VISPQFGHWNFVASLLGGIGLLQLVQTVNTNVLSVITFFFSEVENVFAAHPYICYVPKTQSLLQVL
jgi:hypothetical protein